ncbi:FAD/NAD(P)-binding domain-containing protein [Rhizopogon vinicolor AM-OR11-026]|uniref:FAD/NAD(P)-binding domain-containing protein n=1 Tax=Rhizopogon vinicolor AM-OR11-026 TaxID=1314800 RepID=A0A1B7MFR7_9AGAM|nr:FAD/NAD(P)-binding domain-containing protein [Rhizopogon vinicolor AM-OR11-026]
MSTSSATPKFRVAICGAGIGGLVLAITIDKFAERGVKIDLYEARETFVTAGAGISIGPHTNQIMEELGMYQDISRVSMNSPRSSGTSFRKSDSQEGDFEWFHHIFNHSGRGRLKRQELLDILEQHLPASCTVHFNKRLTTYDKQSAGSLVLHFADDSAVTTDVLIGADGIHSSVRKTLFETIDRDVVDPSKIRHFADASWTGTSVYRALFPVEKLLKVDPNHIVLKGPVFFCGKGKHIFSYQVSRLINVVAYISDKQKAGAPFEGRWVSDVSHEEVNEAFQNFEPAVRDLLKCCENPSRYAIHIVNELPLSTWDRVALIGDACHAMPPHMGAGAGQATEDAFVLGRLLAHSLTTLDNVHAALKAYQDVRLSVTQLLARQSSDMGYMYEFDAPGYYDGTDRGNEREELELLKEKILERRGWESDDGAFSGWLKAEGKLQESVGLRNGRCENDASFSL